MKYTKRFLMMLLAVIILAVSAAPAMAANAYTKVSPTPPTFTFDEKLYITQGDTIPTCEYSFAIDGTVQAYVSGGVTYGVTTSVATTVTGKPSITPNVSFNNSLSLTTDAAGKFVSKPVTVDLSGIEFTEPGIYFWKITKTKTDGPENLTNNRQTLFAVARVIDDDGTLKIDNYGLVHDDGTLHTQPGVAGKVGFVQDEYPAQDHDLTLKKLVAGALGSRNEFFKYTVTIENATSIKNTNMTVITTDGPGTTGETLVYGEEANYPNPTAIVIDSTGKGTAVFWLKHNQQVVIKNVPHGAKYTISESELNGYTPSIDVTGDPADNNAAPVITDNEMKARATVTYTNTKDASTPTGLILDMAAPLAGIVLAGALLAVLLISKKRGAHRA